MAEIGNIENFLKEFFEWYQDFLISLKEFDLGNKDSTANQTFEQQEGYCSHLSWGEGDYHIFQWGKPSFPPGAENEPHFFDKGNLDSLLEKENELKAKVDELNERYDLDANTYFSIINPQYNVFANSLEFSLPGEEGQKIAFSFCGKEVSGACGDFYTLRDNMFFLFNERPQITGGVNLSLSIDADLKFEYEGTKPFHVGVRPVATRSRDGDTIRVVDSYVIIPTKVIGNGALTSFLGYLKKANISYE
ncbi:hypothetical protein HOC35_05420 [Candidatus Woesearchaeota archaeon]|nr:hypothetical protein [Candidatus Woesearchaeota archaeon]